tara:strand:+ start:350 stop:664 length:315 start_codon:yes stop_codon:yes gene_type:complete
MAKGDLTKEIEYDKIEVVSSWIIQVRRKDIIMEEQEDGSKKEISSTLHRHSLQPFKSEKDSDNKWTHVATDISSENAKVQAIANVAWTDDVKTAFKTFIESQNI